MIDEDYGFDPEDLIPSWVFTTDWDGTIWKNKSGVKVDVRNISKSYATNLLGFIKRNLDELEGHGLMSPEYKQLEQYTLIKTLKEVSDYETN